MKYLQFATIIAAMALPLTATAQDSVLDRWNADHTIVFDGAEVVPEELIWQARAVVVFADSPQDPQFIEQMQLLMERIDALAERDVIVIADTDPANPSVLRTALRPRGFMLALLGKDGRTAQRKPSPWTVRELSRSIDKMPLRQQEVDARR